MTARTIRAAARAAMNAANKVYSDFLANFLGDEHEHGTINKGQRRREYLYWETPDQRMFCYTPWKDEDGFYFTWVLKPYGRGSHSGKAEHWKRVGKVVRSRTRKTASKRARTRYKNWLSYKFGRTKGDCDE